MAIVIDGPVVDERPPAFGCGPSFGMLGPTRLVVVSGDIPTGWEHYAGGLVLGHVADTYGGSPPFFAQWRGVWSDVQVSVFLSLIVPSIGLWRLNADFNTTPPTGSGVVTREFTNFQWQMPMIALSDGDQWAPCGVYRIAEWQTVSERFPDAAFPDEI